MAESTDDVLFGPARDAELTRVELELAETKLGKFLDLIPAGLLIHQRQGVIFANNEVSNIFLLSTEELVGRHFLDFIPDDQYDDVKLVFDKCFNERRTIRGLEIKLGNRNGKEIIVQVSMSPLFWSANFFPADPINAASSSRAVRPMSGKIVFSTNFAVLITSS
ncbi:MAG: PAS domain S-box protein [Rhodospirillaceae bacterium]